jgi:hypothetical protein
MRYDDLINFDYLSNKTSIYNELVSKIESAINSEQSRVNIKNLLVVDENLDVVLERSEWQPCLYRAILHYSSLEDFESCAKCKSLLDQLSV